MSEVKHFVLSLCQLQLLSVDSMMSPKETKRTFGWLIDRAIRGAGSYKGPGPRQLKATFPDIIAVLRDMAVDPDSHAWNGQGAEAAAWLSFRELVPPLVLSHAIMLSSSLNILACSWPAVMLLSCCTQL